MTSGYDLFRTAVGDPRCTGNVALGVDSGEDETTAIAAVSGKRIVPVWMFLTGDGTGSYSFSLQGDGTPDANNSNIIIDKQRLNVGYFQPTFWHFGGVHRNSLAVGEALVFTKEGGASMTYLNCTIGYYLFDD